MIDLTAYRGLSAAPVERLSPRRDPASGILFAFPSAERRLGLRNYIENAKLAWQFAAFFVTLYGRQCLRAVSDR